MGKIKVTFEAQAGGPVLDGTAHDAVTEWIDETKKQAGDYAVRQLRAVRMDKTGRGTGHYQEMIKTLFLSYNDVLVSDSLVYGPWLEGTSERNRSTRFKGYRLWRQARQAAQQQAPKIAQELFGKYAERIGAKP
jgi:hypothetical protein